MSWAVVHVSENKETLVMLSGNLDINGFAALDQKKIKLIKYLDPYGDFVCNWLQLEDLLSDLKILEKEGRVAPDQLTELNSLTSACESQTHTYLEFCGD